MCMQYVWMCNIPLRLSRKEPMNQHPWRKNLKLMVTACFSLASVNSPALEKQSVIHTLEPRLCSQYSEQTTGWTNEELSCDLWSR
jgi:hypothetical protein